MTKFCANCGSHHEQRGFFCTADCRKDFRNKKRSERAGMKCRLCGRRIPRPKVQEPVLDGVPREHKALEESGPCQI